MKPQSSFQDYLRSSKDEVSKWPEWKRDVMGVVKNNHHACSGSMECKKSNSRVKITKK